MAATASEAPPRTLLSRDARLKVCEGQCYRVKYARLGGSVDVGSRGEQQHSVAAFRGVGRGETTDIEVAYREANRLSQS